MNFKSSKQQLNVFRFLLDDFECIVYSSANVLISVRKESNLPQSLKSHKLIDFIAVVSDVKSMVISNRVRSTKADTYTKADSTRI